MCFCQQKGTEKEELSVKKLAACKKIPIPNFCGDIWQVYILSYRKTGGNLVQLVSPYHIAAKLVENRGCAFYHPKIKTLWQQIRLLNGCERFLLKVDVLSTFGKEGRKTLSQRPP